MWLLKNKSFQLPISLKALPTGLLSATRTLTQGTIAIINQIRTTLTDLINAFAGGIATIKVNGAGLQQNLSNSIYETIYNFQKYYVIQFVLMYRYQNSIFAWC